MDICSFASALFVCECAGATSCMIGGGCVVQLVFMDVDVWDAGREHLECTELCSEKFDYTAVITRGFNGDEAGFLKCLLLMCLQTL